MTGNKLVDIETMAAELGQPPRTIRTWMAEKKIPYLKLGHRTVRLEPTKVRQALSKFEVRAATTSR